MQLSKYLQYILYYNEYTYFYTVLDFLENNF